MFCATCNLEYPDHLNFCRRCGQTLVRALNERATESVCCTRCGARVVHGEKFCQHCGMRVGAVTQETVVGVCQHCDTYWRNSWQYCKSCGVDREQALQLNQAVIGQNVIQRTAIEVEPLEPRRNCPHCSAAAPPFSLFCENCGMRVAAEAATKQSLPTHHEPTKEIPLAIVTQAKEEDDSLSRLDDPLLDDPLSNAAVLKLPLPATIESAGAASTEARAASSPLRLVEKQRETEALSMLNQTQRLLNQTQTLNSTVEAVNPQPVARSWRAAINEPPVFAESQTVQPARASTKPFALFLGETGFARRARWHVPLLLGSVLLGSFLLVGIWRKAQSAKVARTDSTPQPTANATNKPIALNNSAPAAPTGMAYIPGGKFEMGRLDGTPSERPTRVLEIKAFFLDRTEVTNQQYLAFIEATSKRPPIHWRAAKPLSGEQNLPVVNVTWQDASDFAAWANKRLPTEEEWEFAARGTDGRFYTWGPAGGDQTGGGQAWEPTFANTAEGNAGKIVEVGRYLAGSSPYGVVDLCGNVWEWTSSQLRSYGTQELLEEDVMVIRGGAFDSPKEFATATYRGAVKTGKPYPKTGFRCAKDLT